MMGYAGLSNGEELSITNTRHLNFKKCVECI